MAAPEARTDLSLDLCPDEMEKALFRKPVISERNSIKDRLASPSTGGAVSLIFREPSRVPSIWFLEERGWRRTRMRTPSECAVRKGYLLGEVLELVRFLIGPPGLLFLSEEDAGVIIEHRLHGRLQLLSLLTEPVNIVLHLGGP